MPQGLPWPHAGLHDGGEHSPPTQLKEAQSPAPPHALPGPPNAHPPATQSPE
jgi:hypothetical protein